MHGSEDTYVSEEAVPRAGLDAVVVPNKMTATLARINPLHARVSYNELIGTAATPLGSHLRTGRAPLRRRQSPRRTPRHASSKLCARLCGRACRHRRKEAGKEGWVGNVE